MPTITLTINIEKDLEDSSYKHFLNHENYTVYSSEEDKNNFTMVSKEVKRVEVVVNRQTND